VSSGCRSCTGRRCGDVDGDGTVSSADLEAARAVLGTGSGVTSVTACAYLAAETTGDGRMEADDVELLARMIDEGATGRCML
jgi:hypothetical protein